MSRDGSVTLAWGDGEPRRYRLAYAQVHDLEQSLGCAALDLLPRLSMGRPRVFEMREVLRLGLLGGGVRPDVVARLIKANVEERPPYAESQAEADLTNIEAAIRILRAGLFGVADEADEVGKAAAEPSESAPADGASAPQPITASGQ